MSSNAPDVGFSFGHEGDKPLLDVISQLREELKKLKSQQDELKSSAFSLKEAWASLAGVAATLKLAEFGKAAFESVVQVGRLSAATGISTRTLSVFRKATEDAGLSQETADTAVKRLARSLLSLEQGNRKTAATFALLRDEAGKPLTAKTFQGLTDDQKFLKVVDALGRVKGGLEATGVSSQLLGRNSGELLAVMQRLSGEGFAEVQAQARALGLEVTPEMVKAFAAAKESMANLEGAAKGVAMQFETGLLPHISQLADGIVKVAGQTKEGQSAFEDLGDRAGITIKVILAGFVELYIWAKAIATTILESIGGALEEVGNIAVTSFKTIGKVVTLDFKGAWREMKDGAKNAASTASDVWGNAANRFRQALKDESGLLQGVNGQVPHREPPPIGTDINAGAIAAANSAKLQMELERAKIESQKSAAAHELEIARANARIRENDEKAAYDRGLLSLKEYFQARREEIEKERDLEAKALEGEKTALEGLLTKAQKMPLVPGDQAGEINKQRQILAIKREIGDVETKITLANAHARELNQAADRAEFQDERSHESRRLEFYQRLADAEGNQLRANELKNQLEDLHVRTELEQLGLEKQQIDDLLARLSAARSLRTTTDQAQKGFDSGLSGIEGKRAQLQERVANGELMPYQAERQLKEAIQDEIPILQRKVDLLRAEAELAKSPELRDQLLDQADQDQAKINRLQTELARGDSTWMQWKTTAISAIDQVSTHLTSGWNGWLQGQQRFGQATAQTWNGIVMTAVTSLEKIAAHWLAQHLKMLLIKQVTNQAGVASDAAAAAEKESIETAAAGRSVLKAAKTAAAKAYQSMADIPVIGPILGAIAAAATFTAVMAFGAFAQGGVVDGSAAPRVVGFAGYRAGGIIARGMLGGGVISGPGTGTSDSIPILASNGEGVVTARGMKTLGREGLDMLNHTPELWASAVRGANLPPIRQPAPYTANGLKRYMPSQEVGGGAGETHFHSHLSIDGIHALDGPSVRDVLSQEADFLGDIALGKVKTYFRNGGVNS